MKLFISWSGEFSQRVAERLSIWIPTIIQSVEVFYSPDDIAKGENWSNRLPEELSSCSFGIVCLTPENVAAPWIHFEAGALSMSLNARVSAIMLNVNPSDVKGPLAHYQNTAFEQKDFFRLFQSINKSSETPLRPEILKNAFDNAWDKMQAEIGDIIDTYAKPAEAVPAEDHSTSDGDALQEILRLVRKMYNLKDKECSPSNMRTRFCLIKNLTAQPEEVFSVIEDYFTNEENRKEAFRNLQMTKECLCFIPASEVQQVLIRLSKIGAVLFVDKE